MLPPLANGGRGGNCGIAVRLNRGGRRTVVDAVAEEGGSASSISGFPRAKRQIRGLRLAAFRFLRGWRPPGVF